MTPNNLSNNQVFYTVRHLQNQEETIYITISYLITNKSELTVSYFVMVLGNYSRYSTGDQAPQGVITLLPGYY